ncbi:hypothetical protein [Horticoccus sp. 23ND18S-11]|uniref:hypothetical protein n=1 Tax=Horticoccus sp. 23ND18S-11 TaxID=3391832 RepID=UPI0039C9D503
MIVATAALGVLLRTLDGLHRAPRVLFADESRRRPMADVSDEPPACGEWRCGPTLSVLLHTEEWSAVGGPAPYHDSLTYSFYSDTDRSGDLLAALQAAGLGPTAVLEASAEFPPPLPGENWGRIAFHAALAVIGLGAVSVVGAALFGEMTRLHQIIDRAGLWVAGPLIASLLYAPVYAFRLYRRSHL